MNLQLIARSLIRESIREVDGTADLTQDSLTAIADSVIGTLSDAGLLVEPKATGRIGRPPGSKNAPKAETAAK